MENIELTDLLFEIGEHYILSALEMAKGDKRAAILDKNAAAELAEIVQSMLQIMTF